MHGLKHGIDGQSRIQGSPLRYRFMGLPLALQVFEFHLLYQRFEILGVFQDVARIAVTQTVTGGLSVLAFSRKPGETTMANEPGW